MIVGMIELMLSVDYLRAVIIGSGVALGIGHLVVASFLKWMRRDIKLSLEIQRETEGLYIPPWIVGVTERAFFTTAVAFGLSGVTIAMIAWLGVKLGVNWGSEQTRYYRHVLLGRLSAILAGLVSMLFALIGGLLIRTLWPCR